MALNKTLENILKANALEKTKGSDGIILRERREPKMAVQVIHCPDPVTAIRLSKFSHLSVLKEDNNRKKQCDYLLIARVDERDHVIFVELKKTLTRGDEPKEQLRRSRPFWEYLLSACEIENECLFDCVQRYVIIAERSNDRFDKQRVKVRPDRMIDRERYKGIDIAKIVSATVSFADLASNSYSKN